MRKYKRLTLDEAREEAQNFFKTEAPQNLGAKVIEEMEKGFAESAGSIQGDWQKIIGFLPDKNQYYEFLLYKPSAVCPYVEKIYVRILVSRDPENRQCYGIWQPDVEPYEGPFFT